MKPEAKFERIRKTQPYPRFSQHKELHQLRCPVYGCFKSFNNANQLKSHITRQHKVLGECGVSVESTGEIKISPEIVDYVLR